MAFLNEYIFLSTKRQRQRSSQISYGKLDVALEKIHFQKCERLRLKLHFTNILRTAIAPLVVCCCFDAQFGVYGTKVGLNFQLCALVELGAIVFVVPRLAIYIFKNEPGLDTEINPGIGLTPFPSSVG